MLPQRSLRLYLLAVFTLVLGLLIYFWCSLTWPLSSPSHPLSSAISPTCPSPTGPLSPFPSTGYTCQPLTSQNPTFDISLCSYSCNTFSLHISRPSSSCSGAEWTVSSDPRLDRYIKRFLGPDAFLLRTDGAERGVWNSPTRFSQETCVYEWDVQLRNGGAAWAQVWWEFPNYLSVMENNASWPEVIHEPLLAEPFQLPACPEECQTYTANISSGRVVLSPPPPSLLLDLPPCSGGEPIQGSYIPTLAMQDLSQVPQTAQDIIGKYTFVPHSCRWAHPGLRYTSPEPCTFKPKKVFVTGDSHGRVAHDALMHRLNGHWSTLTESEKMGEKSDSAGLVESVFLWDPVGATEPERTCELIADKDVVAVSLGMWFSAAEGSRTAEALDLILSHLEVYPRCPRLENQKLIYLGVPAHPPRSDHFVQEAKDHVTNGRMELWSALVLPLARQEGWEVVDAFALTNPYVLETLDLDSAHFTGTEALDALVDEIIGKSGLCEV
ncbi:hypothetical protein DACRYDRAFT_104927 [Dacryopinax primogenitus]|uniref:Uncharacterized protein n=1 Tax=Dacryopinax primogenitus (strain DJM 731) TaxID=1858805 RepID=M5GG83_DACPD|nr:uncharacterized protein DACRYDRAFT_104927 [Dacryopinax primogenitus]EJU05038.1 hypothetical protein DACRYDRAFT_104927 [Dacryopinax primogenitus]